jgi:hypothetical protein
VIRVLRASLLALGCIATSAQAQVEWRAWSTDSGTYIFSFAIAPGDSLRIGCTAPSPQGRPAIETESHESHHTGPFGVLVGFQDQLFDWAPPYQINGATMIVGQTGYRLPPFMLDELSGTVVRLGMADPMIEALFTADRLVLDTGQGKAFEYPTAGLSQALDTTMRICVDRWVALGQPLPAALGRYSFPGGTTGELTHNDTAAAPNARAIAQGHIDFQCKGPATARENGLSFGDIDGDGRGDGLVDWGAVDCPGGGLRPFCGASLCAGDVLLSRNNYVAQEGDALLGMSHELIPLSNGNMGVSSSGNISMCGGNTACAFIFYWDGSRLTELK